MTPAQAAALFRDMAERIERIEEAEFAGAFMVVPPNDGGDPIDGVFSSKAPKPATFWSAVGGEVEVAVAVLRQGQQNPGGRGRW